MRKLLCYTGLLCLLLFSIQLSAQTRNVTGRVVDAEGKPVAGASVTVKGQTGGTVTGTDGTYSVSVPDGASALIISYVGFGNQEVTINNGTANAVLLSTPGNLNEVVVIGYGTARKRDVTGAVSLVTEKEFQKGPITTPEQLIAGKAAGVQITAAGGAPGAGSRIRIRGGASLSGGNDPLIVIDGVPVESGVAGSPNGLNTINPNDIESFTILKDPSSAAIYGSRASNGVILITTKKGKPGATRLNFSSNTFVQTPTRRVEVLSADQIREIVNTKGAAGDNQKLGTANTDWQDEIFATALGQEFNLAASGALMNNNLPYRVSGNYLTQNGTLRTGKFDRQSLSVSLSPRLLKDQLSVQFNARGIRTANKFANEGAIGAAITFDPTQPVRTNNNRFGGFFEYTEDLKDIGTVTKDLAPRNPVGLLEMRDDRSEVFRVLGNLNLSYKLPFLAGLSANANLGLDIQQGSGTVVVPDSAGSEYRRYRIVKTAADKDSIANYGGRNNEYKEGKRNKLLDFYLSYDRNVLNNSRIEVVAGYGYQDFLYQNYGFSDNRFDGSTITLPRANKVRFDEGYTLISYYGRVDFTLADKYIFKFTARTDGISKYNPNDRWAFFPSAAVAWRLSGEDFLRNSKTINDLKIRVGYGKTGNQGVGNYDYVPSYTISNDQASYQIGDSLYAMYRPSGYDPFLRWETTSNVNVGVDFGFWNSRLNGSVDFFYRKTEGLLNSVAVALGTNFTNILRQNVGVVESKGVELTLNAGVVRKRDFTLDLGFNFTYVRPEITNLLLIENPDFQGNRVGGISGGTGNTIQIQSVGYRPNSFYVYKQVYDNNGKPIEGLYEDINRDGVINESDLYQYKSPDPNYFLGFSSNATWKKWAAGFTIRGSFENYNYNNIASNLGVRRGIINPLGFLNNGSVDYLNTNFENNQYFSDYYVQNASFLRMDNFYIGYQAGEVVRGANLRVNFSIQNAFILTKYKGVDPEIAGGIDNQFYPRPRIYTLGLNLDF